HGEQRELGRQSRRRSHRQDTRRNEETRARPLAWLTTTSTCSSSAARVAAQHGARVMLAEEYRVGGTCVIRGCVPKKLLVYASRFRGEFEAAAGFGWTTSQISFDWATLIANKDREIARLEAAYGATLQKAGVKVVKSRAVLADAHTV